MSSQYDEPDVIADHDQLTKLCPSITQMYPKLFEDIRIYGNLLNPLFVAEDIRVMLDIDDLHLRHNYTEDIDYKKISIQTTTGRKIVNAFTEQGLYNFFHSQKSEIGEKFRKYVFSVMHELRIKGYVTQETALKQYKAVEESQKKIFFENKDLKIALRETKANENDYRLKAKTNEDLFLYTKAELEKRKKFDEPESQSILEKLQRKYMKVLHFKRVKPPKDAMFHDGETLSKLPYSDPDDQADDDFMCYTTSFSDTDSLGEVYIYKDWTLAEVDKHLEKFALMNGDKKIKNKYYGQIADAIYVINDSL